MLSLSAVLFGLLASGLAMPAEEKPEDLVNDPNREITAEDVKLLSKVGDTPLEKSLRCGLFYAQDELGTLPIERLFVFNATFPASECPTETHPRFTEFCTNLWNKIVGKIIYSSKSLQKKNAAAGKSIGDDICSLLSDRYGVKYVGKKSRRYPLGIKIGMYSNGCGSKNWVDTNTRHPERICCEKDKYYSCSEI